MKGRKRQEHPQTLDSIGGADGDRTRDLLTASFQPSIESIEDKGLTPGIERRRAAKFRNFRTLGATKAVHHFLAQEKIPAIDIVDPPRVGLGTPGGRP